MLMYRKVHSHKLNQKEIWCIFLEGILAAPIQCKICKPLTPPPAIPRLNYKKTISTHKDIMYNGKNWERLEMSVNRKMVRV